MPTFGVAFVVLFPVLYTDTSDAWTLRARDRLAVDLAGVRVELAVAVLATLAWLVLPDGAWRLGAFSLATVSWVMSLLVNLNPFMRFDGYHVLADALDMPNMQERAFALARWRLRELLFAPGEAPPERLPKGLRRGLILYAFLTWSYRLVVFTGIALLVYHATFKLLGIALFGLEIWWFVLRPVARELAVWRALAARQRDRVRTWAPLAVPALLLLVLALPLDRTLVLPASFENGRVTVLRAPRAATILDLAVRDGEIVSAGAQVARLADPELDFDGSVLAARRSAAQSRLRTARLGEDAEAAARELDLARERMAAHERRVAEFDLWAGEAGRVVVPAPMRPGRAVGEGEGVVSIISEARSVIAFASEAERSRLDEAGDAVFVPDEPLRSSFAVTLERAAQLPLAALVRPEMAERHGGSVRTNGEDVPRHPTFRVRFAATDAGDWPQGRFRGVVHVRVAARSYGAGALARIWSVLLRESGF